MSVYFDLCLCAITLFIIWWFYTWYKNNEFYKSIPGPPTVPLLGNALDLKTTAELLNTFMKYSRDHGGIVKLQLGPFTRTVLVTDYKFVESILTNTKLMKKSEDYKFVGPWLGTGLLTGDGPKWKSHRRILSPAFHLQLLENFVEIFNSCSEILIKKFTQEVGKSVDIHPLITLCTLDVICESTMGVSIDAQNNPNLDYVRSVKNMCRIVIERSMSIFQMHDFFYLFSKNYKTQKKALEILHRQANRVIEKKLLEVGTKDDNATKKKRKVFLDILLEATVDGKALTQEEIREEVDTFMFAGHDTTAAAISFTLFCLANHPEVQNRALDEQKSLFGDEKNPQITYNDLQAMKYLDQVIKETLRLYPSVPIYCRDSSNEVEYNNLKLPKSPDSLIIFAYGIHRNPEYFENPEDFDPSRFETGDNKLPYAYIPFSAGPRNCIGQKFAMLEAKCIISKILRNFELLKAFPEHTLKLAAETVLTSVNGVKIGLKLRQD